MIRRSKQLLTALILILGVTLHSSASAAGIQKFWEGSWLPEGVCSYDHEIDALFYGILVLTTVVFFATEITLLVFIFKYRKVEGQKSYYTHGNHKLEMIWTITPAVILIVIALVQAKSWNTIKSPEYFDSIAKDKNPVRVQLFAQQYSWFFRYPNAAGKYGVEGESVSTERELVVPVNTPVLIEQTSNDVIHSFFLPYMRLKQDVVPGMHINAWFDASKTTAEMRVTRPKMTMVNPKMVPEEREWNYPIVCAELCGIQHYQMFGKVTVLTRPEYDKWLEAERKKFKDGEKEEYEIYAKYWKVDPVTQKRIYGGESENVRTAYKTFPVLNPNWAKMNLGHGAHDDKAHDKKAVEHKTEEKKPEEKKAEEKK